MKRMIGVMFIVTSTLLLVWGVNASQSVSSDLSRLFNGGPTDRTMWLILGGAAFGLVGLGLVLIPRRSPQ